MCVLRPRAAAGNPSAAYAEEEAMRGICGFNDLEKALLPGKSEERDVEAAKTTTPERKRLH